ncbi:MAG TPA: carboxypeptidase regulatory-like domain-containing protein [Candidatus Binatia bacterium]|nr:carboxypeptidase regulatory-like domain-containing protein [Candidatus Binatia bacterium]
MTRRHLGWFAFVTLLLVSQAQSAQLPAKGGIIKGTITVAGKPTADVVVSVEGVSPKTAKAHLSTVKPSKAVMDQREMKFIPYVLPVLVGTTVGFPNNDTHWHNVYSKGGAKEFDLGLYPPKETRSVTFDKPGVARILCNAHPTMEAFIVAKEHPYFSGADKAGNYRIDGVPLGKYRVQVWHPQLGTIEAGAELVREGQVLDINFDLKKK